jgi:hypothetical protein
MYISKALSFLFSLDYQKPFPFYYRCCMYISKALSLAFSLDYRKALSLLLSLLYVYLKSPFPSAIAVVHLKNPFPSITIVVFIPFSSVIICKCEFFPTY